MSDARGPKAAGGERRRNPELRELLDELLAHVRSLSHRARELSDDQRAYAQQRLEWLADEIWRVVAELDDRR
jgi:hypothetical protein